MRFPENISQTFSIPFIDSVENHAMHDGPIPEPLIPLLRDPYVLHLWSRRRFLMASLQTENDPRIRDTVYSELATVRHQLRWREVGAKLNNGDRADHMYFAVLRTKSHAIPWKFSET